MRRYLLLLERLNENPKRQSYGVIVNGQVLQGDCLELMQTLPENSIDLIVCDPPYFKVKSSADSEFNWWDNQWDKPTEFLKWIDKLAEQWQRLLKSNGSLYCFASHRMSARVEVQLSDRFNVLTRITWNKSSMSRGRHKQLSKETLRSYFPASESIIFCEHYGADNVAKGETGYEQKCGELRGFVFEPLRAWFVKEKQKAGITTTDINRALGLADHAMGWHYTAKMQYTLPTEEHYQKLQQAFPGYFLRSHESLRIEYESLRIEYESLRRPFNVTADVPYTDVWAFPTVQAYSGKHPCEKPAELLEHIISASSLLNAVVLDCFAGSGSTLLAAKKLGRQYIGIEIDPHWVSLCNHRLGDFTKDHVSLCNHRLGDFTKDHVSLEQRVTWLETQVQAQSKKLKDIDKQQLSIFDLLEDAS